MTSDVWVSVCGVHAADGEQEPVRTVSPGSCCSERGQYKICYQEFPEAEAADGIGSVATVEMTVSRQLHVQGRKLRQVDLIKSWGDTRTRMRFVPGQKKPVNYQTPYGPISMEVETHDVQAEESGDALRVRLQYDLAMEGRHVSTCTLTIEVTPRC